MTEVDDQAFGLQSHLLALINAGWTTQAIAVACELDLPDRLAAGPCSAQQLAADLGADLDALERLLRALVTLEVCMDCGPGTFGLGRVGDLLQRSHPHSLRHWAMLNGGPLWSRWATLGRRVRAGDPRPGGSGSAERFERLESDPHEAELFHGAMRELSGRVGTSLAESLTIAPDSVIVDVGGGSGELLATLLARQPLSRGILFDLAHALVCAPSVLRRHGVASRCDICPGNFFEMVPRGGDLYLMKSVLHDWDDKSAVQILCRCREAMTPQARLVVVERLLPTRPGTTIEDQAVVRSDLNMLIGLAGRERTREEFCALLERGGFFIESKLKLQTGFYVLRAAPL